MPKKVKIVHGWNGMKCKICFRRNSDSICDYHGEVNDDNYCEDFIPRGLPHKFERMWQYHTQRFIVERREFGGN